MGRVIEIVNKHTKYTIVNGIVRCIERYSTVNGFALIEADMELGSEILENRQRFEETIMNK